uniref:Uncharacterized protein n=1 Tax=Haptolina brevifila TaxID=156173 RepID=A0A7S2FV57_9EUKA|mmetsp:Transcript_20760/g.42190  ORF Transcript_20760/g.42190 Transcript_20760/m.42190 type:complete len:187 (+) Transcript_20760:242-802(+)
MASQRSPSTNRLKGSVFEAHDELLEQERRVSEGQSAGRRIDEFQVRLNSLSTQAMLLLGAVLVPLGAETLNILGDTASAVCIYKSGAHRVFGLLLIISCVVSTCASFLVVCGSAWLNSRGQQAYLDVGWEIAVEYLRWYTRDIYSWFAQALRPLSSSMHPSLAVSAFHWRGGVCLLACGQICGRGS